MTETPEQRARRKIDAGLRTAGWLVQDRKDLDLTASRGIAMRESPMTGHSAADYLLYVDRKAAGIIEAKAEGTMTGVEEQSAKYAASLPDNIPAHCRPLPFLFESNGSVTHFTNGLDPGPRSRQVFNFPRPETLAKWVELRAQQLRARLKKLPLLDESQLWSAQARAIHKLEESFGRGDPRALLQMATGSGKTFAAVNIAYRLLKHGGAQRILFLVDRSNLGRQIKDEFCNFKPPDDTRKFPMLYTVQRLGTNSINPASNVVITTIQRLYSMLKGDEAFDAGNEERSAFDSAALWKGDPPDVVYNTVIPPEFFDFIIVDECHRSIYDLWSQVLLYFDSFLIGLTATPDGRTISFFHQNLVMQYGHSEAVVDGVNVDFDVYRIRTKITEKGATIEAGDSGVYVDKRDKLTRAERLQLLTEDLTYTANQLDRDVVSESQIRTVLQQFNDKVLPDAFPDREGEVPKTLIFAKNDSHADDIVRIAREVFAESNEFCLKITYRTGFTKVAKTVTEDDGSETKVTEWEKTSHLTPEEILGNFRNSYFPRIAVTVDMISTGTDVKPIECVFFMRNVKSAGFFEQMKGRGVRVISPGKLHSVSPSAKAKDRFIIVDAMGVCEQDKTDSYTLNRQPSKTLEQVLEYVARGGTDPEALTTLASRLARIQGRLTPDQLTELKELAEGKSFPDLTKGLLNACDSDNQIEAAKQHSVIEQPSGEHVVRAAVMPFMKAAFRRRILEIQQQNEQTIDRRTIDDLLYSGFDASAVEKAQNKVQDFRIWIQDHKDELTALQLLYASTHPLKLSLKDLRELKDALARPPVAATPVQLWRAFEAVDPEKVKGKGGQQMADLVNLVRHALIPTGTLVPYREGLMENYQAWLRERNADNAFTPEQREWLDRMAEHIATSLAIERDDFETGWFGQHGSLGHAHALFGDQLKLLMAELNERLEA